MKFPTYFLNQVHGNQIVRGRKLNQIADGHWTDLRNEILVIKTADCMPIFLFDKRKVMGVHMGWRAFTHDIFRNAIGHFYSPKEVSLVIGPHIGSASLELDSKITERILNHQKVSSKKAKSLGFIKKSFLQSNHYFVDLERILVSEAKNCGITKFYHYSSDTYRSPLHFSHRRNRWRIGTNYSFILKA